MGEVEKSRLQELAEEINQEHQAFRRAFKATYRSALRAGDLLNEAKEETGHGNWTTWVEENCEFSMRTAQVYMRIANNREEVEGLLKNAESAHLSIEGALRSLASQSPSPAVDVLAGEVSPYRAYPPDSETPIPEPPESLTQTPATERKPGLIEQIEASPQGREAMAEINAEFATEGAYLRIRSKIQDLSTLIRHVPPEEAARREFAHHAGDVARDAVMERRLSRRLDEAEHAETLRDWLGEYIQRLRDAEERLQGLGKGK